MATAIGVSTDRTFTLVFAMGAFFAGFGGAMVSIGPGTAFLEMGWTLWCCRSSSSSSAVSGV